MQLPDGVIIRELATLDEMRECESLQRQTWGANFTECVPATILMITQKVGGVAGGAFDADGTLIGFVFGISGVREGRLAHWSHMLAVVPTFRGHGLGRALKLYQRETLLARNIEVMYWTYDPLVAGNAHLNIERLGALPVEYVPNMYGDDTASDLHSGLGTDRFVVEWNLKHDRVERALAGHPSCVHDDWAASPLVTASIDPSDLPGILAAPDRRFRVEVPSDIQQVKQSSREHGLRWRILTRAAFSQSFERGYTVQGFHVESDTGSCYYLLARKES